VGINVRSSSTRTKEHIRIISGGLMEKVKLAGHCLYLPIDIPTSFPGGGATAGNSFQLDRILIHPKNIPSARLQEMGKLYAKYKFTKFTLSYYTERNETVDGNIMLAFLDNFEPVEPKPGTNTRAWIMEMKNSGVIKVWEDGFVSRVAGKGDKSSYFMDQTDIDIYDMYQTMITVVCNGLAANTYYGDLYIDYEIEFTEPYVPVVDYNYSRDVTTPPSTGAALAKGDDLTWISNDVNAVAFWIPLSGIWLVTLGTGSTTWLSQTIEYAARNYYGTTFILKVEGDATTGVIGSYDTVRFTVYPNMAAVLSDSPCQMLGAYTINAFISVSLCRILNSEPSPTLTGRIGSNAAKVANQGPLGIGISVGPGVIEGYPDVLPHLDLSHGRFVCPNPQSYRRQ
jgi:hypothetical protein